jgi:hypothetical protein
MQNMNFQHNGQAMSIIGVLLDVSTRQQVTSEQMQFLIQNSHLPYHSDVSSQLTNRNQGARAASYNAATVVRL